MDINQFSEFIGNCSAELETALCTAIAFPDKICPESFSILANIPLAKANEQLLALECYGFMTKAENDSCFQWSDDAMKFAQVYHFFKCQMTEPNQQ